MKAEIDLKFISKVISLLRRHRPQGISLNDISKEFYKLFANRLNAFDFGFKSLYYLCKHLAEETDGSVAVVDQNHNNFITDRIFFDETAYYRWIQRLKDCGNVWALEELTDYLMPSDVVRQQTRQLVGNQLPSEASDVNKIISISAKVVYVETPNQLFLHLKSDKNIYRDLRQNMRLYEDEEGMADYVFPIELTIVGYVCAVRNPLDWDNWHRGVITHVDLSSDTIQVFAIDFGNTISQERQELRLLKDRFFKDPPLAIKVCLTGIAPLGYKYGHYYWSEESIKFLKSFVRKQSSEYDFGCIFIESLGFAYYSVVMFSSIPVLRDGETELLPFYLHERFIRKGLAEMIPCSWSQLLKFLGTKITPETSEPFIAIKYEPNVDEYETPAETNGANPTVPKKEVKESLEGKPFEHSDNNVGNGCQTPVKQKIDYNLLYFTSDETPQFKVSKYFTDRNAFPFVELKYYTEEDKSFPCFKRKHLSEEAIPKLNAKYYTDSDPTVALKYMTLSDEKSGYNEHKYFTKDNKPFDYRNRYFC